MGCTSSSDQSRAEMEKAVRQQTRQISTLEKTNKELREKLDQILEATHRSKQQENEELLVHQRMQELEAKIQRLETQLQQQHKKSLDDTFSRDSEPDIILESRKLEEAVFTPPPAQPEERPSASILEDPSIKELYERRRQMFQRKRQQPADDPKQPGMG